MRLTKFGKYIRTKRILREMLLGEMAKQLGVSSSFLSSVEAGRKNVPEAWRKKIPEILKLSDNDLEHLNKTIDGLPGTKTIVAKTEEEARFLAAFKRKSSELDQRTFDFITELVEGKREIGQ